MAFALGVAGYGRSESLADAVYLSLQLFVLGSSEYDPYWPVQTARFLAPAVGALAGIKGALSLFGAQIEAARARSARGHVVVCGLGTRGGQLCLRLLAQGERVVGIELDPAAPGVAQCRSAGGLVAVGDATSNRALRAAAAGRARAVVALCGSDDTNLAVADESEALAGRDRVDWSAYAHIGGAELWRVLSERGLGEAQTSSAIEFFNLAERAARALLRQFPLPAPGQPEGREPHLVVVGCGELAQAVVVSAARLWTSLGGGEGPRLRVGVVDEGAAECVERVAMRHPSLAARCRLQPVAVSEGQAAFEAGAFLGRDGRVDVDLVLVCVEDDARSVSAGLALRRRLGGHRVPVVAVVTAEPAAVARFLRAAMAASEDGLHLFGLVEHTCTPELVFDNLTETLARALHEEYLRQQLAAGLTVADKPTLRPWAELEERVRNDNRAQARHVGVKLARVGCSVRVLDDGAPPPVRFSAEEVEVLAELEHERWMDARLAQGWTLGPRDDASRRHPDLVAWRDLTDDKREIDRVFVRALPEMLARASFQVVRRDHG